MKTPHGASKIVLKKMFWNYFKAVAYNVKANGAFVNEVTKQQQNKIKQTNKQKQIFFCSMI